MLGSTALTVREYVTADGASPFRDWLNTLDVPTRARIQARVLRFSTGNLGDHKSVGRGVWEARVMFGPGFRVYFGREGQRVILLLVGGEKSSQSKDIRTARELWKAYKEAGHGKAK